MKQFLFAQAAAPAPAAPAPAPAPAAPAPAPAPAPAATPAAPAATTVSAAPAATTEAGTVQPAGDQKPQPPQQGGGLGMFLPMLIIFAIFYFLMIKPQQRKEKERRKMIQELRAGAKVVFAGGLIGKIVEAKERTFMIEIAGDVVIEVARNAVQGLAADETLAEPAK